MLDAATWTACAYTRRGIDWSAWPSRAATTWWPHVELDPVEKVKTVLFRDLPEPGTRLAQLGEIPGLLVGRQRDTVQGMAVDDDPLRFELQVSVREEDHVAAVDELRYQIVSRRNLCIVGDHSKDLLRGRRAS